MKTTNLKQLSFLVLFVLGVTFNMSTLNAQNLSADAKSGSIVVEGTSNVHDWDIKAENFTVKAAITKSGDAVDIKGLSLNVVAESLKSGKGGMDKNTYKALNTNKHKNITFSQTKLVSAKASSAGNYKVQVEGNLTINGVSKVVTLSFDLKEQGSAYTLTGNYKVNMPTYKVDPPTALMGTIKTGADVVIKYNVSLK